jgi:hypothetical protein
MSYAENIITCKGTALDITYLDNKNMKICSLTCHCRIKQKCKNMRRPKERPCIKGLYFIK